MKPFRFHNAGGLLVSVAVVWALGGAVLYTVAPIGALLPESVAATPDQSVNPDNPCNPQAGPDNPCNPQAVPANPDNPPKPQAGPANPDNPCNPPSGASQPKEAADNPCNPRTTTSATALSFSRGTGEKLDWGQDFRTWEPVTGYVFSQSHGNRLVMTYVSPQAAVEIYKSDAELGRLRQTQGLQPYPVGTLIAMESWVPNDAGEPGRPGPLFFMRKEASGYDPAGGDWLYAFTRQDFSVIGEGHGGNLAFCQECHASVSSRDFVFAIRR